MYRDAIAGFSASAFQLTPKISRGRVLLFLRVEWDQVGATPGMVLPQGKFTALAVAGQLGQTRTGTKRYVVEFRITGGRFVGRRL